MADTYRSAARLLAPLLTKGSVGLKALAFSGKGPAPNKAVYAIVCQILEHKKLLDSVLNQVDQQHKSKRGVLAEIRDVATRYVLLYELLLGPEQKIKGGGAVKRVIMQYEADFRAALMAQVAENPITKHVPTSHWPSYVRVNTLRTTLKAAYESAAERYTAEKVAVHPVVDNLLVLHPDAASTLYDWDVIKDGEGVIQDLSSCLTAVALGGGNGGRWWDAASSSAAASSKKGKKAKKADNADASEAPIKFLDACAAPGNKTTHLAAIVNQGVNACRVMGLDRDSKRVKILHKRTGLLAPGQQVEPVHADFLKQDPADESLQSIKAILLDPSCSGSGIVSQPDRMGNDDDEDEDTRLVQLSNFQLLALIHAMSFPQVDYLAYSTCSVNDIENEGVVSKALAEANGKLSGGERWTLVKPASLNGWERRGKAVEGLSDEQAKCLCRCDPFDGDETNGFFVSYFQREKVQKSSKQGSVGGGEVAKSTSKTKTKAFQGIQVYSKGMWKVEKKENARDVKRDAAVAAAAAAAKVTPKVAAPVAAAGGEEGKPKTKTQERKDKKEVQKRKRDEEEADGKAGGKADSKEDEPAAVQKNRSEKKRQKRLAFKAKQNKAKADRLNKKQKLAAEVV
jgi:putative methyltransferase